MVVLLLLLLSPGHTRKNVAVGARDGIAVGHTQAWDIDGRRLNATTLSLRPLVFEIPDFLHAAECDLLRRAELYSAHGNDAMQVPRSGLGCEERCEKRT